MEKLVNIGVTHNNSLHMYQGGLSPKTIDSDGVDKTNITGIRFDYELRSEDIDEEYIKSLTDLGVKEEDARKQTSRIVGYKTKFYFIGKVLPYEELKDILKSNPSKDGKYAVTYDESGNIIDIRETVEGEEYIPVSSASELEEAYHQLTGQTITIGPGAPDSSLEPKV